MWFALPGRCQRSWKCRSRNDTSILTAKRLQNGYRSLFLSLSRVSLATGPGVFRHVWRRAQSRNTRAQAMAAKADVLAGRQPRDGYDIAGNRYAISRAIHARVMPNTNGIWIYPKRLRGRRWIIHSAGFGCAKARISRCDANSVSRFYVSTSYLSNLHRLIIIYTIAFIVVIWRWH